MRSRTALAIGSALATLLAIGNANSQESEAPNFVIVEIFGCNYNSGNDMSDLMEVTDRWNDWADETGTTDYTASILTPYLYSTAFPYDVIWLGVYPSPESMGSGQTRWLSDGTELNADFAEVVDCTVHAQYVGIATHLPEDPPDQSDGKVNLTAFQDCSLHSERTVQEALAAHGQWGNYLAENGSDVFMGALIPIAGEDPDADYDYKSIAGFDSAEAYGQFLGTIVPGGLQRAGQLFGRLTDCDTSRIYLSNQVRAAEGNNE